MSVSVFATVSVCAAQRSYDMAGKENLAESLCSEEGELAEDLVFQKSTCNEWISSMSTWPCCCLFGPCSEGLAGGFAGTRPATRQLGRLAGQEVRWYAGLGG